MARPLVGLRIKETHILVDGVNKRLAKVSRGCHPVNQSLGPDWTLCVGQILLAEVVAQMLPRDVQGYELVDLVVLY